MSKSKKKNISTREKWVLKIIINITNNIWAYVVIIVMFLSFLTNKLNIVMIIADLLKSILSSNVVLAISFMLNVVLLIALIFVYHNFIPRVIL